MKRSLLLLIEFSIFPAVILILSKLGGIYLAAALFDVDVDLQATSSALMFFQTTVSSTEITLVSSYSDLFMYMGVALGMTVILVQALYLHDTHITPKTLNTLAKYDLLDLMRGSLELYHSGVIWLVFLWIANVLILLNASRGITDVWALMVTAFFSISYSIIFLKDLFTEIELTKNGNYAKKS